MEGMNAGPQQVEVSAPQMLAEVSVTDGRLKYSVEEARLCFDHPLYLFANGAHPTLAQLLEAHGRSPSAVASRMLRVELAFSQEVLLEQLTLVFRSASSAVPDRLISVAIEGAYESGSGGRQCLLVPLQRQMAGDQKQVPMVHRSPSGLHIHCAAYTNTIFLHFAVVPSGVKVCSVARPDEANENEEFDNEVARIAARQKAGEEQKAEAEARHQRDCEMMPRYYKDNWSPDRGAPKSDTGDDRKLLQVGKLSGQETQLSPIKKTGSLYESSHYPLDEADEAIRLFHSQYSKIILRGLGSQEIPGASYVVPLLNLKNLLEKSHSTVSFSSVEYLTALALVSGRRFVQAAEMFRKQQIRVLRNLGSEGGAQRGTQYMLAARYEVLVADCMNQHFQLFEKMSALRRATELFKGMKVTQVGVSAPTKFSKEDIYTSLINMHPHLIRLLLSVLADKSEGVRIATLKCIDFVLENMGCSLGQYVIHLLKAIIATYPDGGTPIFPLDSFNSSYVSISSSHTAVDPFAVSPHVHGLGKREEAKRRDTGESPGKVRVGELRLGRFVALYNHLLDTFASVLSSISSHILHKVFYEIILPHTYASDISPELRSILLKISDKILTICQGDLVLNSAFLSGILKDINSANDHLAGAAQGLWHTVRTKVCPNCAPKTKKQILLWLIQNLVDLAEKVSAHSGSRETAEEDAALKLGVFLDIAGILTSDQLAEEEASSLVLKPRTDEKTDLYVLLNPLLYWLNFTMASEGRLELFKQAWQSVSRILSSMRGALGIDINPLLLPLLSSVSQHCQHSSPTLPMLQFVHIVVGSFSEFNAEIKQFLVVLTDCMCSHVPSFPYEEIFEVCDQLLNIVFPVLPEQVFRNVVLAFIDRYTIKSRRQKDVLQRIIQRTLESSCRLRENEVNFFAATVQLCVVENRDVSPEQLRAFERRDGKKAMQAHDKFIERLNFLMELLRLMKDEHRKLFLGLLQLHQELEEFFSHLQSSGHSAIRLRAHEVLELMCGYYMSAILKIKPDSGAKDMARPFIAGFEGEIVRKEQLVLAKLLLNLAHRSFESGTDSYMQFNTLILLDLLFQNILPVSSFQSELQRRKQRSPSKISKAEILDVERADPRVFPSDYKISDHRYLHIRILTVFKVWPHVQTALNSPWSNIRSITYGLVCSMLKIGIRDYRNSYRDRLKSIVLPLLSSLLGSKESESKAGGLNILGSVCGLSYDVSKCGRLRDHLGFFKRNSDYVSLAIWQQVFELQEDWDSTIREAATVLVQLAAPRESVVHFNRVRSEARKLRLNCIAGRYGDYGIATASRLVSLHQGSSELQSPAIVELLDVMGRSSDFAVNEDLFTREMQPSATNAHAEGMLMSSESGSSSLLESNDEPEEVDSELFFVDRYTDEQIKDIISIFRNDFKPPKNLWIEKNIAESVAEDYYESEELLREKVEAPAESAKASAGELPLAENAVRRFHMVDNLEDKMVGAAGRSSDPNPPRVQAEVAQPPRKESRDAQSEAIPAPSIQEKSRQKGEEEELNKKDSLDAEPFRFFNTDEEMNQDDLEIIELEDEDFLHSLEEDKVPVLKNAYASKKNKRPTAPKPGSKVNKGKAEANPRSELIGNTELPLSDNKAEARKEEDNNRQEEKQEESIPDAGEEGMSEEDIGSSLRLKKSSNQMRPMHGLRPITPPLKGQASSSPPHASASEVAEAPKEKDAVAKEEQEIEVAPVVRPHTTKAREGPVIVFPTIEDKIPAREAKGHKSFLGLSETKKLSSSKLKSEANKSFEHYHTSRIATIAQTRASNNELPTSSPSDPVGRAYHTSGRKRKAVQSTRGKIRKALEDPILAKRGGNIASHQSSSLPATPKQKEQLAQCDIANLVRELQMSSKKKTKHKRQPQQNFAQTSPALAAILKSLKPSARKAGESTVRTERPAPPPKPENVGKRIAKRAKKFAGVKMISERQRGIIHDEFSNVTLKPKKIIASIKKARGKPRVKSKSQAQGVFPQHYHPIQTINITTDQIALRLPEEKPEASPLRNNYIEGSPTQEPPVNQTY